MKTNKLAIAILAATLPTLANANEDINQILGGNQAMENPGFQAPQAPSFPAVDENMSNATNLGVISAPQGGHPNDPAGLYGNDPMMGQNGVPGMNAQPNGMMPNPINPMGMQQGQVVQKYLQAEDEDNLKVDPNNYLEDETAAAEAVISSINDKIVRKDQSEISKFEEIDEYKSEIRVIEMKSQMAAMEAELIKSQAEIKKIRDEMNVDKTRERVEKEVLKEYNKKVKELKGKHNKEIAKLEKVIIEKETEVKKAEGTVKKKEAEYKKLQGDMEALGKAKDQEIAYMAEEVLKKMEEISSLEKAIEDMQKQEEEDMSEILREEHVALAKIFGRGDQLKAKLYVLENVFEIQEEDDIKNDGTVIVKEITSEYVVLTMNEEDFTFYPMGEKRAAIMVSNALARQQNQEAQRELERLNNGLQSVMNPGNLNQGFDNQMGMQPGFDPNMQMMQQPMMQQPMMQQSQPMMMPQPTGAMNGPQQASDVVNFSGFDGMSPEQMPPQGEVYTQGGATVSFPTN